MEGLLLPCCSIFFSVLLCIVYFVKKKTNSVENNMYKTMLVIVLLDGIISTVLHTIPLYKLTPFSLDVISILNKLDFSLLLIYVSSLFIYTTVITIDRVKNYHEKLIEIVSLIDFIFITLILTGNVNVISSNGNYSVNGSATNYIIISIGAFLLLTLIIALANIKKLDKRHIPIVGMFAIIILLILVFNINPYLTIISISLTFLNYIMYFTIENPDVKKLKKMSMARKKAEDINLEKTNLINTMSYEIRTPLNTIVAGAEDIQVHREKVPDELKEDIDCIIEASKTLLNVLDNNIGDKK